MTALTMTASPLQPAARARCRRALRHSTTDAFRTPPGNLPPAGPRSADLLATSLWTRRWGGGCREGGGMRRLVQRSAARRSAARGPAPPPLRPQVSPATDVLEWEPLRRFGNCSRRKSPERNVAVVGGRRAGAARSSSPRALGEAI